MSILTDIGEALEKGKRKLVVEYVQKALDEGVAPQTILSEGLLPGMDRVGVKFRDNEIFVPEVLVAARAMSAGTDLLKPLLAEGEGNSLGTAVIGTVKGDLHDIGKNLVKMMIEGKGINVVDLGVDVSPERFVRQIKHDSNCNLILVSANRTQSRVRVKELVDALIAENVRDSVFLMVGGSAVDDDFVHEVGADAYTRDATEAANVAYELLSY